MTPAIVSQSDITLVPPTDSEVIDESTVVVSYQSPNRFTITSEQIADAMLQIGHRVAAVSLLTMLGYWAVFFLGKSPTLYLGISGGGSDLALCLAIGATMVAARRPGIRREARSLAVFSLLLFALSLSFIVMTRIPVIRAAATDFFSPNDMPTGR